MNINASGGRGGDSSDGGRGGDGGHGGKAYFIDLGKTKTIKDLENPHKEYWGFIWRELRDILKNYKWIPFLIILLILAYLGVLKYSPEINTFIGQFKLNLDGNIGVLDKNNSELNKLNESVFNIVGQMFDYKTSLDRKEFIKKYSGLKVFGNGTIVDIGSDGLTILLRGTSDQGKSSDIVCEFDGVWKQRLSILKTDSEIKFDGIIDRYDPPTYRVYLSGCSLQ